MQMRKLIPNRDARTMFNKMAKRNKEKNSEWVFKLDFERNFSLN